MVDVKTRRPSHGAWREVGHVPFTRFPGLGHKTGGEAPDSRSRGVGSEDTRRHHEACVEAKRSREEAGSVRSKEVVADENALRACI